MLDNMPKEPKIIKCRNTKYYKPEILKRALSEASQEHVLTAEDPKVTRILDQTAPFKQRKVKTGYAPNIDNECT